MFEIRKNRLWITGLGKNGTFINGAVIRNELPVELKTGDNVRLGPEGPEISVQNVEHEAAEANRRSRTGLVLSISAVATSIIAAVIIISTLQSKLNEQAQRTQIL
ncbi:MAG: FHA domain-containing protein [Spirochaetales bacterium]|nr:FHA domain-containing protein [Spirochaetales bacterium]